MKRKFKIALSLFIIILICFGGLLFNNIFFNQKSEEQLNVESNFEMPPFDKSIDKISENQELKNNEVFIQGFWVSYIDLKKMLLKKSEDEFTKEFLSLCENVKQLNINTLIVQVRPFSDALYSSEIFPWSHIITGTQGESPNFDPLEIMLKLSKENNLSFHAWINPYRIKTENIVVAANNPATKFLNNKSKDSIEVVKSIKENDGNGENLYYNPASEEAQNIIINGIKEIIDKYKVDGIHFDDYFYPTQDESFDKNEYEIYKQKTGENALNLRNWRQNNVDQLVKNVYKTIKDKDETIIFGISPAGDIDKVCDNSYANVKKWAQEEGFIDYICPQIYYGFNNTSSPFEQTLKEWSQLFLKSNVKIYIGLPLYKCGKEDKWAGDGKREFIDNNNLISQMVVKIKNENRINGFILYDYKSLFMENENIKNEIEELKKIIGDF